jgi:predicted RNase H-like HicB family nuclease
MNAPRRLTAIIEREDDGFEALCPELDIASQGTSVEEARTNLVEALTLFFETAPPSEVVRRAYNDVFVTQVEVPLGGSIYELVDGTASATASYGILRRF